MTAKSGGDGRVRMGAGAVRVPSFYTFSVSRTQDGEAEDDEGNSKQGECISTGKDIALVLDLPPKDQSERRLSTDSTRSSNSTQSNNSDIQLHLQSMFFLLHREDTLKMVGS